MYSFILFITCIGRVKASLTNEILRLHEKFRPEYHWETFQIHRGINSAVGSKLFGRNIFLSKITAKKLGHHFSRTFFRRNPSVYFECCLLKLIWYLHLKKKRSAFWEGGGGAVDKTVASTRYVFLFLFKRFSIALRSIKCPIQRIDHNILKDFLGLQNLLDLLFDIPVSLFLVSIVYVRKIKIIVNGFNAVDTFRICDEW